MSRPRKGGCSTRAHAFAATLLAALALSATHAVVAGAAVWPSAGQSIENNRTQPAETLISPVNVKYLRPKWVFTDHGDAEASPTVYGGDVFFPDFGGYLNAVNAQTGAPVWERQISEYDGQPEAISHDSPAVFAYELILGDNFSSTHNGGAHLFAVSRATGRLLWSTQLDAHPAAIVTSNPVVVGDTVIVGVSSIEEGAAENPTYPCCTFRGSVVALNAITGKILWKTYTIPPNSGPCQHSSPASGCGYSGGAVWAAPAIDQETKTVYAVTGNNYTVPDEAEKCQQEATEKEVSDTDCTAPDDYFDSVLALNLQTGAIRWGRKVEGFDATNDACIPPKKPWCPSDAGDDYDFGGGGPNLFTVDGQKVVGAGQKSGVYWAFNSATGAPVWNTLVGPGSSLGGIEWGTAYDGERIYVPVANFDRIPFRLAGGEAANGGSWAALNPSTGEFDWQVGTPGGSLAMGPVSEANGVVYAGTMAPALKHNMFALSAATGQQLWSFTAEGSVNSSPAIVNGMLFWGSGYPDFRSSTHFYAFSLFGL